MRNTSIIPLYFKKILSRLFVLILISLPFSYSQALSLNSIVDSIWSEDKTIKVPNFIVVDINGKTHTQETTKGKYLVVNFWATWCPPCLKEIPALVEFYEKNKDLVEIIGLDYEQADRDKIIDFTESFLVNYPIVLFDDNNESQFGVFGEIMGMPTTYIYDTKGVLIKTHLGEVDMGILEQSIL
jgi:thiol-disulfide isomerase/thioredoxin